MTPSLAAYCATCVLPTSITSGGSVLASALVTFCVMPFHSWIWIFRSSSGWSRSNSDSKRLTKSSVAESFISQTVMSCLPPDAPGSAPQADRTSNDARTTATGRFGTSHLSADQLVNLGGACPKMA